MPLPPKVKSVPGEMAPALVTLRAALAAGISHDERSNAPHCRSHAPGIPRAATGSHPPETNPAANARTCDGLRPMSKGLGTVEPELKRFKVDECLSQD